MDVTKFVVSGREKAKVFGDYSTYRNQLSNRIHNLRKKLGIATKPRSKFTTTAPVTADDIARNHEYAHLLLLTSERAWANAMSMREIHITEKNGITGSARSHIISRLQKAVKVARHLFELLADQSTTGASLNDVLEARAYSASLAGAKEFEKQSWEPCVHNYSEARVIYSALATSTKDTIFTDLLADPIDDSIRYSAYQMGVPRTVSIPSIARKHFVTSDAALISQVKKLDADVLSERPTQTKAEPAQDGAVPKTIVWRSRTVDLVDAAIATALGSVAREAAKLEDTLASANTILSKASAYDDILVFSQDAVDATKTAIDELVSEKVGPSDKRIQSLQITRTAVSYDLISWRIGRNRVLVGEQDGLVTEGPVQAAGKKSKKPATEANTGQKLAKFREKAVLYSAILQSLDSIKELPGVAKDTELLEELDAKYAYFSALKCLTIARSHALLSSPKNALALLARALTYSSKASTLASPSTASSNSPPNVGITAISLRNLQALLTAQLTHYRALVELNNLTLPGSSSPTPLVESLNVYPASIDLTNLVTYPPKLEPVPVKPLFFDAAWNYIEYPGREIEQPSQSSSTRVRSESKSQAAEQKKKGWFGFGR